LQNFGGFDYANPEARREYIRSLVEIAAGRKEQPPAPGHAAERGKLRRTENADN
jgi:hypothetical protein